MISKIPVNGQFSAVHTQAAHLERLAAELPGDVYVTILRVGDGEPARLTVAHRADAHVHVCVVVRDTPVPAFWFRTVIAVLIGDVTRPAQAASHVARCLLGPGAAGEQAPGQ